MVLHNGENLYIYGMHDKGGEHLMMSADGKAATGWVLVTEAIGSEAHERGGGDYSDLANKGLGVLVRLNQSYGTNGTIPREARYPEFAQRVANFVEDSRGAGIWLIGNEMNFEREQPRQSDSSNLAEPITPRRYAKCYKMCRQKIKALPDHQDDLVMVGAPAPWNAQTTYEADPEGKYAANPTGDWIQYFQDILLAIGADNCDAIAIHAYTHGYDSNLVFSEAKMSPPFENLHYNFYTYKDHLNVIPENMRHLPLYLTEANGDKEPNGDTWPFGNNGWIQNAYSEIDRWNKTGQQQIRCMILFRWMVDNLGWTIDGKFGVQQDFTDAIAHGYQWDPDITQPIPRPELPGYRTRYLSHNTPTTFETGKDVVVSLTLQNAGSFTWVAGGANPFQLGFQWFNTAGQLVPLQSQYDYRTSLPNNVPPNGQVTLQALLRPPDAAGTYQFRWDMVHEMVTWFTSQGDAGLLVSPVAVKQAATPPVTKPKPVQPTHVQVQNISNQLARSSSKRYVKRPLESINRVIIHHAGVPPTVTVQRIAEYQVNDKGLPGITYHFCTTDKGEAFQTQPLTVTAAHAGQNSFDSVGVCLIGNFMETQPPEAQLNATASALAQVLSVLKLTTDNVFGYSEIVNTQSPGATWPMWKGSLFAKTQALMGTSGTPVGPEPDQKPLEHYMLFWYKGPGNWANWDLRGAFNYIDQFSPAIGFSIEEAQFARAVTIVGGPGGVPSEAEQILRNAGCKVERIAGVSESDTRRILDEMAASGQRFKDLK